MICRPSKSDPSKALIAASPSSEVPNETNPNPLDRPVSRSVHSLVKVTFPKAEKVSNNMFSSTPQERFLTKHLNSSPKAGAGATASRGAWCSSDMISVYKRLVFLDSERARGGEWEGGYGEGRVTAKVRRNHFRCAPPG